MEDRLVAGEPVELLAQALGQFELSEEPDGMIDVNVRLEPELGVPFFRALMPVESELLLQNANALGGPNDEKRTTISDEPTPWWHCQCASSMRARTEESCREMQLIRLVVVSPTPVPVVDPIRRPHLNAVDATFRASIEADIQHGRELLTYLRDR